MVLTQSQIMDVQTIVESTLKKFISDKDFLGSLAESVAKKVELNLEKTFSEQNKKLQEMQQKLTAIELQNGQLLKETESLRRDNDMLQQYTRRNNLRIYGIPEKQNENTDAIVINLLKEKLNIDLGIDRIERSHRIGNLKTGRHIIVKFSSYRDRHRIFENRRKLKGTGIVISEDLTKTRLNILKSAQKKFNRENVWSLDGTIWIKINNQKFGVRSEAEFEKLV